jgi:deoxyribodipyrimidine photo-lyase
VSEAQARKRCDTTGLAPWSFTQEVFWRTYWKGWLEQRPFVWRAYQAELSGLIDRLQSDEALSRSYQTAVTGQTGLDCFDFWVQELRDTGYLHNHARMWFASIWIFTLKLPWVLGADFFYRHLLDGDPASNTLSWRWVAGLQTKGKTYLARSDNIHKYTDQRFSPHGLATEAIALQEEQGYHGEAAHLDWPDERWANEDRPVILLITEEHFLLECWPVKPHQVRGIIGLQLTSHRSPLPVSEVVTQWASKALTEAMQRAASAYDAPATLIPHETFCSEGQQLLKTMQDDFFVTAYAPQGPVRDALLPLKAEGLPLNFFADEWDRRAWPLARKGFFPFRKHIADLLAINKTASPADFCLRLL